MSRDQLIGELAQTAVRRYSGDAARQLERMGTRKLTDFLESQEAGLAAALLTRLPTDCTTNVIEALRDPHASEILGTLEPAHAAALLARLGGAALRGRLGALDAGLATELRELLTYPPGVTGRIMDPHVITFASGTTAREAMERIRALEVRTVHDVFITDDEGRLTGSVGIHALALAPPGAVLRELAHPTTPRVQALAPQDELVAVAEEGRLASVPVVDISDRLLGVIRYADLLSATQRDGTADLQTMVGVSREERAFSSLLFAVRKRLPWLTINLATAFLAASVVGLFEDTIARFTALAVLLPVVAGQLGNTCTQALAVTMRGLALREIRVRHWFRVGSKELIVGAINGVAVALATALGVYLWSRSVGLAAVIGAAMVCSMVVAGLVGASVPMALILIKQDPAAASSIVLTTITDVMGFLTFPGFATLASGLL